MKQLLHPENSKVFSFSEGEGKLPLLPIHNEKGDLLLSLYGAHILSYIPKDKVDLLWTSPYSPLSPGLPIRGGIPVCFPWFGSNKVHPNWPLHGFVRTKLWDVVQTSQLSDGQTQVILSIEDDEETRQVFPFHFLLTLTITVGSTLSITMCVTNTGNEAFQFEEGLHSYFACPPDTCSVTPLDHVTYYDKDDNFTRKVQTGDLGFSEGGTTNFYMDTPQLIKIRDLRNQKTLMVQQDNFQSTIVWNPGKKSGLENQEIREHWNEFVCVEPANCIDNSLALLPGYSHKSNVVISMVEKI